MSEGYGSFGSGRLLKTLWFFLRVKLGSYCKKWKKKKCVMIWIKFLKNHFLLNVICQRMTSIKAQCVLPGWCNNSSKRVMGSKKDQSTGGSKNEKTRRDPLQHSVFCKRKLWCLIWDLLFIGLDWKSMVQEIFGCGQMELPSKIGKP